MSAMAFKKFGAPDAAHLSFVQPESSSVNAEVHEAEERMRALREAALRKASNASASASTMPQPIESASKASKGN